jgi:twinkle protein
MPKFLVDEIDFEAYLEATEFQAKVIPASDYADSVKKLLDPHAPKSDVPGLLLRKSRDLIKFGPAEVTFWAGYNGHRKSMFTSQVALDLAAQGQRVLIASLEMLPEQTMSRMTRQACGMSNPVPALIDKFHGWLDGRLWLFNHVGRLTPEKSLAMCRYFAEEKRGQHIFLDSWMMICASEEHMDEQKQFCTDLYRLAQETGLHIHVVGHCRKPATTDGENRVPTRYDLRGASAISDQASNVYLVWMNKKKFRKLQANPNDMEALAEPCAVLSCDKQRHAAWEGSLQLWFDTPSLRFCDDRTSPVEPYSMILERSPA